ncbi:MAG: macro domain-containing protein [Chloroflexota bacterium]|nr:macro domain-containing protein [Chloroflexota bacterium]
MIEIGKGNLLEANVEALINTVNCVGVMGKGIALQFKQAFPDNFHAYKKVCDAGMMKLGEVLVVHTGRRENPIYIINFPTKYHWKGKSYIPDIELGLQSLVKQVQLLGIESIAVPPLGCGNGGLDWKDVRPLIEAAVAELPNVRVLLFEPGSAPQADTMPVRTKPPRMNRTRALVVSLLSRYRKVGYKSSLLEVQKLLYFLQTAGEPLNLQYVASKYGPYAEKVNFILQNMEGHFIKGYGDRSSPSGISVVPEAIEEASALLANAADAEERLERVSKLIDGFETPYSMELLATVHWVAQEDTQAAIDVNAAIAKVRGWSQRKNDLFTPEHIREAWEWLQEEQWLPAGTIS